MNAIQIPSRVQRVNVNPIIYSAGAQVPVNMDTSNMIRKLTFQLTQRPTLTTGNNVPANVQPGDGWAAMQRITLTANGSDVLVDIPGRVLPALNYFCYRRMPQMSTVLGNGGANPSLVDVLDLPFEQPCLNARPADTWLWPQPFNPLQLQVTWAPSWTAVNSAATAYTTSPQLTVNATVSTLGYKATQDEKGNPLSIPQYPTVCQRITSTQQIFSAANPNQQFQLPTGKFKYRGLLLQATTTASPAVDTAALFSNVEVWNGTDRVYTMPEPMLNAECKYLNDKTYLKDNSSPQVTYAMNPFISASSTLAGWYFIDFCPDGRLSEAPNTVGTAPGQFYLNFNLTTGCTMNVFPIALSKLSNGVLTNWMQGE